jgi:hypothetical protein
MEVQELRPGLWRWTASHPQWDHAEHWGPDVASVYAELPEAVVVVDPLVPDDEEDRFWAALDRDVERLGLPVHVLLTVHWHERSVPYVIDRFVISRAKIPRFLLHQGGRDRMKRDALGKPLGEDIQEATHLGIALIES